VIYQKNAARNYDLCVFIVLKIFRSTYEQEWRGCIRPTMTECAFITAGSVLFYLMFMFIKNWKMGERSGEPYCLITNHDGQKRSVGALSLVCGERVGEWKLVLSLPDCLSVDWWSCANGSTFDLFCFIRWCGSLERFPIFELYFKHIFRLINADFF